MLTDVVHRYEISFGAAITLHLKGGIMVYHLNITTSL
jgi:hypothetical protein